MAISENLLLKKLSGHIGKQLVIRQYGDQTVISKYPDMSRRILSPKQVRINEIMAEANYRARGIIKDEALRNAALLRLNVTRNRLYNALVKEYFKTVLAEAGNTP
jgi:hypothetical protein